jgi:hypothetical protein
MNPNLKSTRCQGLGSYCYVLNPTLILLDAKNEAANRNSIQLMLLVQEKLKAMTISEHRPKH